MRARTESAAVVALLRNGRGLGSEHSDLIEDTDSALGLLEREHGLLTQELVDQASREIDRWRVEQIQVLTLLDPDYPENLRAAHDRPPLIFLTGRLQPEDHRAVAVIGSRSASAGGRAMAAAVARDLVANRYTVVSGLAVGIDTAAHMAALECGGRTIAVIGTGVRRCYPTENRDIQRRIARDGAVVSRFWPDTAPARTNFPLRNAVMSGMSLASVLIEASHQSGARAQARMSLAQGRPVVLFEPLLKQQWARDLAARPGTHVVGSPAEVTGFVDRLHSGILTA
jgi:DNA processing protein